MACRRSPRAGKIQVGANGVRCRVTGETFVKGSLRASFMENSIALKAGLMLRFHNLPRRVKRKRELSDWHLRVSRNEQNSWGYHISRKKGEDQCRPGSSCDGHEDEKIKLKYDN